MQYEVKSRDLPFGALQLNGFTAKKMNLFFDKRIRSADAHDLVYQETEDAFRTKIDDATPGIGIWQGEYWGKWMLGAIGLCRYSHDEGLKNFIRKGVHQLIALQDPSGYLGTYRDPMNVFPADAAQAKELHTVPRSCNWNIWCRKYTLWGLVEAYDLLEDPEILLAAEKLAKHLINSLHDNKIALSDTGLLAGLPSCSILKPIIRLYQMDQDAEFFDFAEEIIADWKRPDGKIPNLIINALSGKPVHEWYPESHFAIEADSIRWAKVYEMQSCFEGILAFHRLTGDPELLEAAIKFHAVVKQYEINPLFSVGYNDRFGHAAAHDTNAISEPCDAIHWMRLCHELFLLTGDKKYLDDYEFAFFNSFLASVYRNGEWGARGVRSHGHHLTAFGQAKMKYSHCCVNNMPRAYIDMTRMAVTMAHDTVSVNLYDEYELKLPELTLKCSGNYLAEGTVRIEIHAEKNTRIRFRIPGWASAARCSIDGRMAEPVGEWFQSEISNGKTVVSLEFDRELEIRHHRHDPDEIDYYYKRWVAMEPGMENCYRHEDAMSLVYGPLLLVKSKDMGLSESEIFAPLQSPNAKCRLIPIRSDAVRCAFEADFGTCKTIVCDYVSGTDLYTEDTKYFNIYF